VNLHVIGTEYGPRARDMQMSPTLWKELDVVCGVAAQDRSNQMEADGQMRSKDVIYVRMCHIYE